MKLRTAKIAFATAACAAVLIGPAHAQSIVNIQGYGDGAGANIDSYPVAPGTVVSLFNPVLINLPAGDYTVSDAWGLPGAVYDAWNFQTSAPGSWDSHYVAAQLMADGSYVLLIDGGGLMDPICANHFCAWSTEAEAAAAFLAAPAATLHLTQATTMAFASADYYLPDNAGGISLLIQAAVPEPAAWQLCLAGLTLGVAHWTRRRAARA